MTGPHIVISDIAFTPIVKAFQTRRGSRATYARMEQNRGWAVDIDDDLRAFIEAQTSVFLGTANLQGQSYIQHRGGPTGFLKVLDNRTIAFADFAGNRQYISTGNLADNPKAHLFLMDYAHRQRVKIWGNARLVEGDAALTEHVMPQGYKARAEQVILFTVTAWDANCPQHIPLRMEAGDVQAVLTQRDARIAALETEIAELQAQLKRPPVPTRGIPG